MSRIRGSRLAAARRGEPLWFEINMLRCIYCGYCEEVCPEEAIVMSKEYDLTFQDRNEAIFGLERLLMPVERLKDRLDYLEHYRDPQFGQHWDFKHENNIHSLKDRHFLRQLAHEGVEEELEGARIRAVADPKAADADWGGERHGPPTNPDAAA